MGREGGSGFMGIALWSGSSASSFWVGGGGEGELWGLGYSRDFCWDEWMVWRCGFLRGGWFVCLRYSTPWVLFRGFVLIYSSERFHFFGIEC